MQKKIGMILLIVLLLAGGRYAYINYFRQPAESAVNTDIDNLIGQTTGSTTNSTGAAIDIDATADGGPEYEGGGSYADFSEEAARAAIQAGQRVILVFERKGDPTSEALHNDITQRQPRIPKNTIIFFVDVDVSTAIRDTLDIERPNTIVFIGKDAQEIRRKGNGIVTLSQIVKSIDGLITK